MNHYLLGVDIGTQGTKTCLYDVSGQLIASAFEASNLIMKGPGMCEQDPHEIYGSVVRTVKSVVEQSGAHASQILALGMDGQMAGILGVDAQCQPVTPYDSWLDTRCEPQIEWMKRTAGERVLQITGAPVTYAHGPKILWWKQNQPEAYRRIAKFILPTTYVAAQLCGLRAEDTYLDYTCAHFSGYADIRNLVWSQELLEVFQVEEGKLPAIVAPWKIVGTLTDEAARACGLAAGMPVCAGAGDQAATSLGAGIVRPGLAFDVAGTASVFACCVSQYTPDVKHRTILFARSVLPDLWIPLGYINGGGLCVRWIRDVLAGNDPAVTYDALAEEARRVAPGSDQLLFVPHFGGRVCPNDPYVRGSFTGLNYQHTRAHMYRAVLESIGYEYRLYQDILSDISGNRAAKEIYCIGGGSKSALFNQIKADILGVPYTTLDMNDTGTLGAAIIAGYAIGAYRSMAETADSMIKKVVTISPDTCTSLTYTKMSQRYRDLIEILRAFFQKGA